MTRRLSCGPIWAYWMVTVDECRTCGCIEPVRKKTLLTKRQKRWIEIFNTREARRWAADNLARARAEYALRQLGIIRLVAPPGSNWDGRPSTSSEGQ